MEKPGILAGNEPLVQTLKLTLATVNQIFAVAHVFINHVVLPQQRR